MNRRPRKVDLSIISRLKCFACIRGTFKFQVREVCTDSYMDSPWTESDAWQPWMRKAKGCVVRRKLNRGQGGQRISKASCKLLPALRIAVFDFQFLKLSLYCHRSAILSYSLPSASFGHLLLHVLGKLYTSVCDPSCG